METMSWVGLIVISVFFFAFAIELVGGRIKSTQRPVRDALFTLFGMMSQGIVAGSFVGAVAGAFVVVLWPSHAGALSHISFWIAFPLIFMGEEMLHYWIHRYAHEWRWMWKLHRTHHSAQNLNVGVVYRYNVFWVAILPQTWVGAFAVYFGLGEAFAVAVLITFFVNVLSHTSYRWDLALREKMPWSEPFWKVLERIITLPDTHHAHHSYGKSAHPNGNYAVTLFIYDVIFGTAKIPNQKQTVYGLPISPRLHWAEELFWPLVKKPLLPKPESIKQS